MCKVEIGLFDQERLKVTPVSVDLPAHAIGHEIYLYTKDREAYNVDGFIEWLQCKGVKAERIGKDIDVFYFSAMVLLCG